MNKEKLNKFGVKVVAVLSIGISAYLIVSTISIVVSVL